MDITLIETELNRKYFLIKKRNFYYFIGGFFAVLLSIILFWYSNIDKIQKQLDSLTLQNGTKTDLFDGNTAKKVVCYSKTFIFWIPNFNDKGSLFKTDPDAESNFDKQIESTFGGFSKWSVDGVYDGKTENGKFYQVSVVDKRIKVADIAKVLNKFFVQDVWYITEFNH